LRQFCQMPGQLASSYWEKNTDGHPASSRGIKKRIRNFTPIPDLTISDEVRAVVCPKL